MEWNQLLDKNRIRNSKTISKTDIRSEFQKDYHRIIISSAFRRLQDKTQVFPLEKSDFIRTRLTHSLEVSSIAKSLGQSVCHKLKELKHYDLNEKQEADINDILLCAGLLHDIGNPPFGHFGEVVIQDWFKVNLKKLTFEDKPLSDCLNKQMICDFENFEGNAQTVRIVSKLHSLIDINGMNLTMGLLSTLMKYPCNSTEVKKDSSIIYKKMGYFYSEKETYNQIIKSVGINGCRHPLTFLLEAADDIAYMTADLEDAAKKKLITIAQIINLYENIAIKEDVGKDEFKYLNQAIDTLKTMKCENEDFNVIQNWLIYVQGLLIYTATYSFTFNYIEIMNGSYNTDLFEGTHAHELVKMLKDMAYQYIFRNNEIQKLEIAAEKILGNLLDIFVPAVLYYNTDKKMTAFNKKVIDLISKSHLNVYLKCTENLNDKSEDESSEKLYLRLMMVTDFISGMTDSYAKNLYKELNGLD